MNSKRKIVSAGAALLVAAAAGTGIAAAGNDTDTPITGEALDKASAAALAHTGEGRVTETEVGDEESLYEVEVALDDGSQVDVQLDETFAVVGEEADNDTTDD